jgi:hypothetical protein
MTYLMALTFLGGETARRGLAYFSVNATTMIEDYSCGAILLWAAWCWAKKQPKAPMVMAVAWAYATGGMLVPFAAHLEGSNISPGPPTRRYRLRYFEGSDLGCLPWVLDHHSTQQHQKKAMKSF